MTYNSEDCDHIISKWKDPGLNKEIYEKTPEEELWEDAKNIEEVNVDIVEEKKVGANNTK